MDEFYKRIQMFLIKKKQEYGELCYLSSRITQECILHIDSIRDAIAEICQSCNIPIETKNLYDVADCIIAYKYLVLNTNFKSQEHLMEDIVHGHLVDMCPSLSPYLLIEILWRLNYEDILTQSIPYMPLDLSIELLEIARRCVDSLHFERALQTVVKLITKSYEKIVLVRNIGTQTTNLQINLESLVVNIQEVIALLADEKFLKTEELSSNAKFERIGMVLKKIIETLNTCLKLDVQGVASFNNEKHYTVTFGRMPLQKCDEDTAAQCLATLHSDMANLLLKKIKEVDCNCYLGWAEVNDLENRSISLQRAIGLKCYKFLEDTKFDERLKDYEHLMECLQQISSKPEPELKVILATISLQDLIKGVDEGKKEYVKELINRNKNWDDTIFDHIKNQSSLIDNDDCIKLLDYLILVQTSSQDNIFKQKIFLDTNMILLNFKIVDMVTIILEHMIKYDGSNMLESAQTESFFKDFITQNPNFESATDYKKLLLFILKSPKKIMRMLIKASIGHPDFRNVMLSMKDLFIALPFMTVKDHENNCLLLGALRDVCMENFEWDDSKFNNLLANALKTCVSADEVINIVFMPYLLANNYTPNCLKSILRYISTLFFQSCTTKNTNIEQLLQGFAKKMSFARKDKIHSRFENVEIICMIIKIIEFLFVVKCMIFEKKKKCEIAQHVESFLEPLDKVYFNGLWNPMNRFPDIFDIIRNYERRCFFVINKVKDSTRIPTDLRDYISDFGFLLEDFLRHAILRCTETEYHRIATDIVKEQYEFFNWRDWHFAYENLSRITYEACQLVLEFPEDFSPYTFPYLLKVIAHFMHTFQESLVPEDLKSFCDVFLQSIISLNKSIRGTPYAELYEHMTAGMNNDISAETTDNYDIFIRILDAMERFANSCIEQGDILYEYSLPRSASVLKYRISYEFVNACMAISGNDTVNCLMKINQFL